jgi:hypothetical protein
MDMNVTALQGTLYITDSDVVKYNVSDAFTVGSFDSVGLSSRSSLTLGLNQDFIDSDSSYYIVSHHFDPAQFGQQWLYASNLASLELEPAMLSAFSIGVLKARVLHSRMALSPGFCPYVTPAGYSNDQVLAVLV